MSQMSDSHFTPSCVLYCFYNRAQQIFHFGYFGFCSFAIVVGKFEHKRLFTTQMEISWENSFSGQAISTFAEVREHMEEPTGAFN